MKRLLLFTIITCLSAICISSCKQHPKEIVPAPEFAAYISAYTGGMIGPTSSIAIELTHPQSSVQINSEVKEPLFSFKPSLKGKAYWISNQSIRFIPDEGALKPGQRYAADFKIGLIMETDPALKTFPFSFRVEKQSFVLELAPCVITEARPDHATVQGTLRFSHPVPIEKAELMLSSNISGIKPLLETAGAPGVFKILYEGIPRQRAEQNFEVEANGKVAGIDKKETANVWIPKSGAFYPLSVHPLPPSENGLEVVFSEPLLPDQNLRGLITPYGGGTSYVYQIEDNRVRIFFERRPDSSVKIEINRGVKSATGMAVTEDTSWSVAMESPHPKIELPFPGSILPDAKSLILPFKTVNLTAIDLRIIRIFEHNVLSFLQTNTLNTYDELRRSGRLIKQMSVRLDQEADIRPDTWHEFSLDLAPLIQQEPGAIYRIELSMQQAYSLYPGANIHANPQRDTEDSSRGMISLKGSGLSEQEEAFWDQPSTYYYDSYGIDWNIYEWSERRDPTKPSYYMNSDHKVSCNVIASNLGVIAKYGAPKMWITVSDISTVKPVKDAQVTVYNFQLQPIGAATTDADGFAVIEPDGKPFALTAKYQEQTTYLKVLDGQENSLSRFDVGGKEVLRGLKGYIYGERGVWRPGDTLFLSFILEDKGQRLPASHPVSIELYQPTGQFYFKEMATVGKNGFYTFKIPTRPQDPTGLWSAYVKVGGSSFYKPLRIETIKPNRLKINLSIPNDRIDASRNEVQAQLSASWLTGATARNLTTHIEMHLFATSAPFKGFEQYLFNNPATDFNSDSYELFDGQLDDNGVARFRFKVPQTDQAPGMLRANMLSRVYEPGGDASISSVALPFSPFDTYIGINLNQKKDSWIETDTDHTFDVVALSPLGTLKNISKPLEYKIYKLNWSWWWEHHNESLSSYINNRSVTPQASGTVVLENGKGAIKFRIDYPSWGRYLVYVKDPSGGHATGGIVYVDWPSWRGRAQAADPDGISMLSFSTDKTSYQIGETVHVMIPSAVSGRAMIAIENGSSVLSRNWVEIALDGATKYSFKVTPEMSPNFYVHISLLQPYAQTINDLPIRMYGVLPVLVEDAASHLNPTMEMPDVLRPEQPFTLKIKEQNAKQMTYTLAIVDDGLLDLTNFKTPDPWSEFYAREALGVKTWDMYHDIMGAFGGAYGSLFSIGGDESLNPSGQKANRFKPVVKFLGPFSLKKGETGTHKITLPPYIGSVRVMVVAGASGAYGNASKTVPVRSPLMLLSTLPRVLSVGEDILLPVNIFAMEEEVKEVQVQVEASDILQISGNKSQTLHFNATGDQLCYFSLHTGQTTGSAKVKVTAVSGGHSASETIEIQLRNPNPIATAAQEKLMNAGAEASFAYQLAQHAPDNRVTLEVSRIPSVDLSRRYDWLENYEHCCTEQLTSKGFPWLYIEQFKEVDKELSQKVKVNITEAIRQLYGRQLPNGGFVYWPDHTTVNEWITSYAGNFLLKAKEKGYEVNANVLKRWKEYQQRAARNWSPSTSNQSDLVQAYRLYTLALAGAAEKGAMNRMREVKNMTPQAKWRLAAAYAIDGQQKAASELIWNVAPLTDTYQTHNYTYGSTLRDEAMILETMVLMNDLPTAFAQARIVSEKLSNAYWFDTQSTVFSLIAMGSFAEKAGKGDLSFEWSLNGEKQKPVVSAKPLYQTDLSTVPLSGTVTLQNKGGGDLYVRLITKEQPLTDQTPAISNHLKIEVSYTDLNGKAIDPTRLLQGSDFMAMVKVSNISGRDYTDLALTHIVPSGWEIFNERMFLSGEEKESNRIFTYQDIRDDRVFTYFDLPYNRSKTFGIRLQAAYAGNYILPALFCEAMYDTQAQAKTEAGRVEVVK